MKPIGITFADEKFLPIAKEQQDNFNNFDLEHRIIKIDDSQYNINLWLTTIDKTIEAIHTYGKIFKVDSEVRLHKPIPIEWESNNNVFFFIEPTVTSPYYVPINTGQIILDESSLEFLNYLKIITKSLVPPIYDNNFRIDDEDMVAPAIALSNISFLKEIIDYNRTDNSIAKATRGDWRNSNTVLTHPFIHNWENKRHFISSTSLFKNHFMPTDSVKKAEGVILGIKRNTTSSSYWKSLGFTLNDDLWNLDDWFIDPPNNAIKYKDYTFKTI